jgi:hypothetical protein
VTHIRRAVPPALRVVRLLTAAALLLPLISCSRLGPFRHFTIDPDKLTVSWSSRESNIQRDGAIFYQVWPNQRGRHFVDELVLPVGSSKQFRYNAFHVDNTNRLITRSKYQELLTGAYGTVYAETTYHYAEDYKADNWATSFTTALYAADVPHEPFQMLDSLPSAEALELSAISVVRVFKNGPEFVVASANYAHDGHLESISINGSRDGKWLGDRFTIPGEPGVGSGTLIGGRSSTRQAFGLPGRFPVTSYLAHPTPVFGSAILTSSLDVVNLHYNRNRWVKQDSYGDGAPKTRFLSFQFTAEDKILDPIDRQRLFGEYAYTRDPNLEKEHSD